MKLLPHRAGPTRGYHAARESERVCERCCGYGTVDVLDGGWDEPAYRTEECEECMGTGHATCVYCGERVADEPYGYRDGDALIGPDGLTCKACAAEGEA